MDHVINPLNAAVKTDCTQRDMHPRCCNCNYSEIRSFHFAISTFHLLTREINITRGLLTILAKLN